MVTTIVLGIPWLFKTIWELGGLCTGVEDDHHRIVGGSAAPRRFTLRSSGAALQGRNKSSRQGADARTRALG